MRDWRLVGQPSGRWFCSRLGAAKVDFPPLVLLIHGPGTQPRDTRVASCSFLRFLSSLSDSRASQHWIESCPKDDFVVLAHRPFSRCFQPQVFFLQASVFFSVAVPFGHRDLHIGAAEVRQ